MAEFEPKIDDYIVRAQPFAQEILEHLRILVHKACPDIQETVKWGFPHFEYKGIVCSMGAFKKHCAFGFWKSALMKDPHGVMASNGSAGNFNRITSVKDLPSPKILIQYIREAVALNDADIKLPAKPKAKTTAPVTIPTYFTKALSKNKSTAAAFKKLSPSHQKEYVAWITEAKTEETRNKRMATALKWITEGKSRHWKYAKR